MSCIACKDTGRQIKGKMWVACLCGAPRSVIVSALPEPPAPPEDCCCNAEWRGRLCSYHQGFEDGWEALRAVVEG